MRVTVRITDRDNEPRDGGNGGSHGRGNTRCGADVMCADHRSGRVLRIDTTLDAIVPGAVREGSRAIWELGEMQVFDGGPDVEADTEPNGLFLTQGLFVP